MPAHAYSGSTQVESIARVWNGSGWTDDNDNLWAWDGSAWKLIQPFADSILNPPINLVVSDITDHAATVTWENPDQEVTPTHVQVRVPEETPIWTEYDYGTQTFTWPTLDPETAYQFQVRYVVRVDGIVTLTSASASVFFDTLAPAGPSLPAPEPGGPPTGSTIYWPNTGSPGPVGGSGCWWEYVVQELDLDWIWVDTAVTDEIDGDIGALDIDFIDEGIACGTVCRLKYREVCNSVPDVWEYGGSFVVACDYDDSCGGVVDGASWTSTPFTDAILAMPQICWEDERQKIEDFITGQEYTPMPGYYSPGIVDGDWVLNGAPTNDDQGTAIAAGYNSNLAALDSTTDLSFSVDVNLSSLPLDDMAGGTKIAVLGNRITLRAYQDGAGYRIGVVMPKVGGGSISLQGTNVLTLNDWWSATITIDQDGDKILFTQAGVDATDSSGVAADLDDMTSELELYGNASARIRKVAAWDRALDAGEAASIGYLYPWPYLVDDVWTPCSSVTSVVATLPDVASGDILILQIFAGYTQAVALTGLNTAPAGWNVAFRSGGTSLWWKIADGSESTVTVTFGGTSYANSQIHAMTYRNVDPTNPLTLFAGLEDTGNLSGVIVGSWDQGGGLSYMENFFDYYEGSTIVVGARSAQTVTIPTVAQASGRWNDLAATHKMLSGGQAAAGSIEGIHENNPGGYVKSNSGLFFQFGATSRAAYSAVMLRSARTAEWLERPHCMYVNISSASSFGGGMPPAVAGEGPLTRIVSTRGGIHGSGNTWATQRVSSKSAGWACGLAAASQTISLSSTFDPYSIDMVWANADPTRPLIGTSEAYLYSNLADLPGPNSIAIVDGMRSIVRVHPVGGYSSVSTVDSASQWPELEPLVGRYFSAGGGDGMSTIFQGKPDVLGPQVGMVIDSGYVIGFGAGMIVPAHTPVPVASGLPTLVNTAHYPAPGTHAYPSGYAPGDLMIAMTTPDYSTDETVTRAMGAAGWACLHVGTLPNSWGRATMWYRWVGASDSSVTISATDTFMMCWRNVASFTHLAGAYSNGVASINTAGAYETGEDNVVIMTLAMAVRASGGVTMNPFPSGTLIRAWQNDTAMDSELRYDNYPTKDTVIPAKNITTTGSTPSYFGYDLFALSGLA